VAVRMHWSTAADQPKSYESCLTVVTLIEGCPRKRNSAKQALKSANALRVSPPTWPLVSRDGAMQLNKTSWLSRPRTCLGPV